MGGLVVHHETSSLGPEMAIDFMKVGQQRLDEWKYLDEEGYCYHKNQWDVPKRSTLAFEEFVSGHLSVSKNVIDMGAGSGAATAILAQRYREVNFTAFDYSSELIAVGRKIALEKRVENLCFEQGDWFNMKKTTSFDGCISLQTLSWLPEFCHPLVSVFRNISPKWMAITSLFYEGDITCRIEVEEHKKNRKCFYNVYSIPAIGRLCAEEGYSLVKVEPFKIDIDIERPTDLDVMGTYTRRLVDGINEEDRVQISGPLLMNWYMLLIEKTKFK